MNYLEIRNPATGEMIREIAADDSSSIGAKFEDAKEAQSLWRSSTMKERLECAVKFKSLLLSQIEALARDLTLETGKPISQSRGEIKSVTSRIDFFVESAAAVLAPQDVSRDLAKVGEIIEHEPLGVVANISAWNYPYFVGLNVITPALIAGNAVVYKASEYATLTGLHIVRLLGEAGFPKKLIASVIGRGQAGESLIALPINGLFFTGSHATGEKILSKIASRMMRVQLELGGKDGIYVCDDANLDFAVPSIAEGAFYNTGQGCCSVERIFVHQNIYERFKRDLVSVVNSYPIGDPFNERTFIGPLTRPQHVDFLQAQLSDAAKNGAKTLLGGHRLEHSGFFFAPTIIECDSDDGQIMREESFGPVVVIQSVANDAEAAKKLNGTAYGLTAGVYSPDKRRAMDILRGVEVGTAYWNCCDRVSPYLPWTGRKSSGIGVTLSTEGIRCFTQSKAWHLRQEPTP